MHAVNIFRAGFDTYENHFLLQTIGVFGIFGGEHHLAGCSARAGGKPTGDDLFFGVRIERWVQQLIERGGVNPQQCFFLGDEFFFHHIDCNFQTGFRGTFAISGLQHP